MDFIEKKVFLTNAHTQKKKKIRHLSKHVNFVKEKLFN